MNKISDSVIIKNIGLLSPRIQELKDLKNVSLDFSNPYKQEIKTIPSIKNVHKKELRYLSKLTKYALYASYKSIENVNLKDYSKLGLYFSLTHGSSSLLKKFHDYIFDYGPDLGSPLAFSNGVSNAPLSFISSKLGITDGGTTIIGAENTGLQALNEASFSIINKYYNACLVGASEEYFEVVDYIYKKMNLFKDTNINYLPKIHKKTSTTSGFKISEGSVFLFVKEIIKHKINSIYYAPYDKVEDLKIHNDFDLIISGASNGLHDKYELKFLENLKKQTYNNSPILFSKPFFGETFSVSGLLSLAIGYDILKNKTNYKLFPLNPSIKSKKSYDSLTVRKILIISGGRNGQISFGVLYKL